MIIIIAAVRRMRGAWSRVVRATAPRRGVPSPPADQGHCGCPFRLNRTTHRRDRGSGKNWRAKTVGQRRRWRLPRSPVPVVDDRYVIIQNNIITTALIIIRASLCCFRQSKRLGFRRSMIALFSSSSNPLRDPNVLDCSSSSHRVGFWF